MHCPCEPSYLPRFDKLESHAATADLEFGRTMRCNRVPVASQLYTNTQIPEPTERHRYPTGILN